ncbi:MAG: DUF1015 domain-containing protein [Treponema sp.]|nr:DUF1015 domain-containing protein [Treponema sp.]
MNKIRERLKKCGIEIPEILLPRDAELRHWAVIACDQFTQDRPYWQKAAAAAGGRPSTLDMIFPEAFLGGGDGAVLAAKIESIHRSMQNCLDSGVFAPARRGLVYLERDTPFNRGRRGLVAAVDLERYDWSPSARPLIRATEGTVPERLPPRMDIRRNAPLETQHVILLIDDEKDALLPAIGEMAKKAPPAYHGELMLGSGSAGGWLLDAESGASMAAWAFLAGGLEELAGRAKSRYAASDAAGGGDEPFLFAVGDGNHSLASAKGVWEEYKAANALADGGEINHPCRYALIEIENIYDPAITFEPIHRVVFNLGFDAALGILSALPGFSSRPLAGREQMSALVAEPVPGNRFGVASGNRYALVETSAGGISTASLQPLLDSAAGGSNALSVDYIHGEDELFRLSASDGAAAASVPPATGILLPPVQKAGFFETVARCGPLPRKSFSMGEAVEKRFYIECRKLFG